MLLLNATEVRQALPMDVAIAAMKAAFAALSSGKVEMPLRTHLPVHAHNGVCLIMPAFVHEAEVEALVVKVVSVYPNNSTQGLSTIHGEVLVLDPGTGRLVGLLEGGTLTGIRTGAASGLATDLLARDDSQVVAIFGAGMQARYQLEAVCTVRPIKKVWVYSLRRSSGEAFVVDMAGQGPIPTELCLAETPQQALAEADIVCTATTSPQPVFSDTELRPGVHINAIGSHLPTMQEVPNATVARALIVVDSRPAALAEAGDIIQPLKAGLINTEHILAELGELVLGKRVSRTSREQVTLFKSVGVAVQDAFASRVVVQRSRDQGLGQKITW